MRHSALALLIPAAITEDHPFISLPHFHLVHQLLDGRVHLVVLLPAAVLGISEEKLVHRFVMSFDVQVSAQSFSLLILVLPE